MKDEAGMDEKIIAVPAPSLHPYYDNIDDVEQLRPIQREQIEHFFAHYKDLESGKWSETVRWGGPEEAQALIVAGIKSAQAEK